MYIGPPIDDIALLPRLPIPLRDLLTQANGYVAYHGGLHVRGACHEPAWHSLRAAWEGDAALHRLWSAVREDDVPFAEDVMGDQFLVRDGIVHRLAGETGDIESLAVDVAAFQAAHLADPVGFLSLEPLLAFREQGGQVAPGMLLHVYPPFCARHAGERSYAPVPALEARGYLADLARQIRDLPRGQPFRIQTVD